MKAKKVDINKYDDLAQNGARILFDIGFYRVLDCVKDDLQNFFIIDFYFDMPDFFLVGSYDFAILLGHKISNVDEEYIIKEIEEIIGTDHRLWRNRNA
jgi:hypothetical protein